LILRCIIISVNIHYKAHIFVEQKYATSVRFVKSAVRFAFKCLSLSGLGVTAQGMFLSLPNN